MNSCWTIRLEPRLNQLFICRSGLQAHTEGMTDRSFPPFAAAAHSWRVWLSLCLCLVLASPAGADSARDHERARAALQAGEVMPLQKLLERVQRQHPGDVLEVELEREDGRWVYELKLLQRGGQVLRLDVDGRTGDVLRSRTRGGSDQSSNPAAPVARPAP
jgi:hypothetical protein